MAKKAKEDIRLIPIKAIKRSKLHWKREHTDEDIKAIADQIASIGLTNAITVREHDGSLELLAGDLRLRAVKKLGFVSILATVKKVDDTDGELVSIYENTGRAKIDQPDMDAHIARAVELETKKAGKDVPRGKVIDTVALRTGKTSRAVTSAVRSSSQLIPEAKQALKEGKITKSHAEELEPLDPASQRAMLKNILKKGLTVEQVADKKAKVREDKAEDKDAAYLTTARRYLTGAISLGNRFRQALNSLNEHIEERQVPPESISLGDQAEELQTIMTTLDWTMNLLAGR